VTGEWQKQQTAQYNRKFVDSSWLVLQYWL
jgi:hypothetical protein